MTQSPIKKGTELVRWCQRSSLPGYLLPRYVQTARSPRLTLQINLIEKLEGELAGVGGVNVNHFSS